MNEVVVGEVRSGPATASTSITTTTGAPHAADTVQSVVQAPVKPSRLRQRLAARHEKLLEQFQTSLRELNSRADAKQKERSAQLKAALTASHAATAAQIAEEVQRVETHSEALTAYESRCREAAPGDVLTPYEDVYYRAEERDFGGMRERLAAERRRLLRLAIVLRESYESRLATITTIVAAMEEEERGRRAAVLAALQEQMLSLAKISYVGIPATHVLAQRVIHEINGQLATNYLGLHTLRAQLQQREVLKQRQYSGSLAAVYANTQRCMARSGACWLRTLLQSEVYRRPAKRFDLVHRVTELSAAIRHDGAHFIDSLSVTVQSLREVRRVTTETVVEDSATAPSAALTSPPPHQVCGGSGPAGWLRQYDDNLLHDVFPTSPSEVVDEWRMRANVVLRNSLASCVALIDATKTEETARAAQAAQLKEQLLQLTEWVFSPLEEEYDTWQAASIGTQEVDDVYGQFVLKNVSAIAQCHAVLEADVLGAVQAIEAEAAWFTNTVERGLRRGHEVFAQVLLLAYRSVLRLFEKATEELARTATAALSFVRRFYRVQCYEARKDYEDHITALEERYASLTAKLVHAGSGSAAEELFAEGLRCLREIASTHTTFHKTFTKALEDIVEASQTHVREQCVRLQSKLGVEAAEDTRRRLLAERRQRRLEVEAEAEQAAGHPSGRRDGPGATTATANSTSLSAANAHGGVGGATDRKKVTGGKKGEDALSTLAQQQQSSLAQVAFPLRSGADNNEADEEDENSEFEISTHYPQITVAGGVVFNVIGPMVLLDPIKPVTSSTAGPAAAGTTEGEDDDDADAQFFTSMQDELEEMQRQQQAARPASSASSTSKSARRSSKKRAPSVTGKGSGGGVVSVIMDTDTAATGPTGVTQDRSGTGGLLLGGGGGGGTGRTASIVEPTSLVSESFIATYRPLFADTIANEENFIRLTQVRAWRDLLRETLLSWLLELQRSSHASLVQYCTATQAVSDEEINQVLRQHRRRPAAFQADVYEARVRELENTSNVSEKYCARLRERVEAVELSVDHLHSDTVSAAEDAKLLRELQELERSATEAASLHVLQVQERRFASLTLEYVDRFAQRCSRVMELVERQKDALEQECTQYLADRAKALASEVHGSAARSAEEAVAQDPLTQRVTAILQQLTDSVLAVRAYIKEEQVNRQRTMDEAKVRYQTAYNHNIAELHLLSRLQETMSRVKTQVHSQLLLSKGDEDKLEQVITALEGMLRAPVARPNLAVTLRSVIQRDYALETSRKAALEELTDEVEPRERAKLEHRMQLLKANLLRRLRASEASSLLSLLDQLRGMLYTRGRHLHVLVSGVEMVRVNADYYIEPKPLPAAEIEAAWGAGNANAAGGASAAATGGGSGGAAGGKTAAGRRGKGKSGAGGAAGNGGLGGKGDYPTDPLPVCTSLPAQAQVWFEEVQAEVAEMLRAHFATYAPPLFRRLPGMRGGGAEDVLALLEELCQSQEKRVRDHVAQSIGPYNNQVHRVHTAVQTVALYLADAVYALTAGAVEQRVKEALAIFGAFYSYTSALKAVHKEGAKVALASKANRDRLLKLRQHEATRQAVTDSMIELFWGIVLREMQDEAGLHAARCVNTTDTFFALLRGLVSPAHLVPSRNEAFTGPHRGLKHLVKMRNRTRQLAEAEPTAKKERRLQETMPLLRIGGTEGRGGKDRSPSSAVLAPPEDGTALPLTPQTELEYPGLPLCHFRPLEPFNTEHPNHALPMPLGARQFYPLSEVAVLGIGPTGEPLSPTAAAAGGAQAVPPSSSAGAGASGTRRVGGGTGNGRRRSTELTNVEEPGLSPSFRVPPTSLHLEAMVLAKESILCFNAAAQDVVADTAKSFSSWQQREAQWLQNWSLTISRLANVHDWPSLTKGGNPATGGGGAAVSAAATAHTAAPTALGSSPNRASATATR